MNNKNGNKKNKKQKELMIKYWWQKAQNSFDPAKRKFKAEAFEFAINRLYYSIIIR